VFGARNCGIFEAPLRDLQTAASEVCVAWCFAVPVATSTSCFWRLEGLGRRLHARVSRVPLVSASSEPPPLHPQSVKTPPKRAKTPQKSSKTTKNARDHGILIKRIPVRCRLACFSLSMVWLGLFSYLMVTAADGLHQSFGLPMDLLGITVCAIGRRPQFVE